MNKIYESYKKTIKVDEAVISIGDETNPKDVAGIVLEALYKNLKKVSKSQAQLVKKIEAELKSKKINVSDVYESMFDALKEESKDSVETLYEFYVGIS